MDNGEIKLFKRYRVQANYWLEPFKGGFRFHQDVYIDDAHILENKQIKSRLNYQTYIPVSYLEIADLK